MKNDRRHKRDTKTFGEETFSEQSNSINIKALWFLAATRNHMRKCAETHGNIRAGEIPSKVAGLLRDYADKVEAIKAPAGTTVPVTISRNPSQ
jgi:hypothetical protein